MAHHTGNPGIARMVDGPHAGDEWRFDTEMPHEIHYPAGSNGYAVIAYHREPDTNVDGRIRYRLTTGTDAGAYLYALIPGEETTNNAETTELRLPDWRRERREDPESPDQQRSMLPR